MPMRHQIGLNSALMYQKGFGPCRQGGRRGARRQFTSFFKGLGGNRRRGRGLFCRWHSGPNSIDRHMEREYLEMRKRALEEELKLIDEELSELG